MNSLRLRSTSGILSFTFLTMLYFYQFKPHKVLLAGRETGEGGSQLVSTLLLFSSNIQKQEQLTFRTACKEIKLGLGERLFVSFAIVAVTLLTKKPKFSAFLGSLQAMSEFVTLDLPHLKSSTSVDRQKTLTPFSSAQNWPPAGSNKENHLHQHCSQSSPFHPLPNS